MAGKKTTGFAHEDRGNKNHEWGTPAEIFELLNIRFDLDPCHPKIAYTIPVDNWCDGWYTKDDDGLKLEWVKRTYLNLDRDPGKMTVCQCQCHQTENAHAVSGSCRSVVTISSQMSHDHLDLPTPALNVLVQELGIAEPKELDPSIVQAVVDLARLSGALAVVGVSTESTEQGTSNLKSVPSCCETAPNANHSTHKLLSISDHNAVHCQVSQVIVDTANVNKQELPKQLAEQIQTPVTNCVTKSNAMLDQSVGVLLSVSKVKSTTTNVDSASSVMSGVGLAVSGNDVNSIGISAVPIVEHPEDLLKITSSQLVIQHVPAQSLVTSSPPVIVVTVAKETVHRLTGSKTRNDLIVSLTTCATCNECQKCFEYAHQRRIWMNPPYGDGIIHWMAKMHEHGHGISLVFARTDVKWYLQYAIKADAILYLKKRLKFVDMNENKDEAKAKNGAGAGSMLVAWGADCVEALARLKHLGDFRDLRIERMMAQWAGQSDLVALSSMHENKVVA